MKYPPIDPKLHGRLVTLVGRWRSMRDVDSTYARCAHELQLVIDEFRKAEQQRLIEEMTEREATDELSKEGLGL